MNNPRPLYQRVAKFLGDVLAEFPPGGFLFAYLFYGIAGEVTRRPGEQPKNPFRREPNNDTTPNP